MIKGDATTNKLCSLKSVWASHRPNSFKKAIERMDQLIDSLDETVALKASAYTIDQHAGKATQKTDITSDGKSISPTIVNVISPEQKKEVEGIANNADDI